jgi:hypothetical protein
MEETNDKEVQIINEIFVKAVKDPEFRNMLLKEPSSILDKYSLSEQAKKMILEGLQGMQ